MSPSFVHCQGLLQLFLPFSSFLYFVFDDSMSPRTSIRGGMMSDWSWSAVCKPFQKKKPFLFFLFFLRTGNKRGSQRGWDATAGEGGGGRKCRIQTVTKVSISTTKLCWSKGRLGRQKSPKIVDASISRGAFFILHRGILFPSEGRGVKCVRVCKKEKRQKRCCFRHPAAKREN